MEKGYLNYPVLNYNLIFKFPDELGPDNSLKIEEALSQKRDSLAELCGGGVIETDTEITGKVMGLGMDFDAFRVYGDEVECRVFPSAVPGAEKFASLGMCVIPKIYKDMEPMELTSREARELFRIEDDVAKSMIRPLKDLFDESLEKCGVGTPETDYALRIFSVYSKEPSLTKLKLNKDFCLKPALAYDKNPGLKALIETASGTNNSRALGSGWRGLKMDREELRSGGHVRCVAIAKKFGPDELYLNGKMDGYMLAFGEDLDRRMTSYIVGDLIRGQCFLRLYTSFPNKGSSCGCCGSTCSVPR